MDNAIKRNFLIFIGLMIVCSGSLIFGLILGERTLDQTDNLVTQTQSVIIKAEELSSSVEAMLAAQRGYLLTGDDRFFQEYEKRKSFVSQHIATLNSLTKDNPSQQSRLDEMRGFFTEFATSLESRAEQVEATDSRKILQNVETINNIKNNISRVNNAILEEEYVLLNERISELEGKKSEYFYTLLIGIVVSTILLLTFNTYLLNAQRARIRMASSLKETEDRLKLAIEGTQDGIFDWDIHKNEIYYSRQFFDMLGYHEEQSNIGTPQDFRDLIHPEDLDKVWSYVEQYLDGSLSEFSQEFRMKHSSGKWVWIQSRAKALFDDKGKAYRIVGAHSDITHLVKEQEKLKEEKKEAEASNQAKSEFLAHMSHEIRTPLTAITGIAEIMGRNQDNLDHKQKQLIKTLHSSSFSLKELVNDILDFSKIDSGELELDENVFDLESLFQEVISMISLRAEEKNISFVLDYNDIKGTEFYGDKKRMRQILVNLIGNAIKFTEQGGVTVSTEFEERDNETFLRINVSDTGIGIDPQNFDLVFERFKQGDTTVSRKYGGTGLGLPISRNLARLMGGDIFLSSQLGKGSTFTVLLPQKLESFPANKEGQKYMNEKLSSKIQASLHNESKLLLVEDYEGNIVIITYILDEIGLSYDIARTGQEALDLWSKNHYDVILMDVQMPEMDGFTATKEIRKKEKIQKLEETPIIGMTAHALVGDKDKCIEAGMNSYLPKPIIEDDLKKEILNYLSKQQLAA